MFLKLLGHLLQPQINKLANLFWQADPSALMQAEYDHAVAQLREGRIGLEQYRAFVERVGRQVARHELHVKRLEDSVKNYLQSGDRESAAKFALWLQRARKEVEGNDAQVR